MATSWFLPLAVAKRSLAAFNVRALRNAKCIPQYRACARTIKRVCRKISRFANIFFGSTERLRIQAANRQAVTTSKTFLKFHRTFAEHYRLVEPVMSLPIGAT
jgi:hypothetical protein